MVLLLSGRPEVQILLATWKFRRKLWFFKIFGVFYIID